MNYRLKVLSAALLTALAVTACDSDDDGGPLTLIDSEMIDSEMTDAEMTDTETADSETGDNATELAAYFGTWSTGCVASQFPDTGVPTYFNHDLQFDATTWQFTISGYLDESCTVQFLETGGNTFERGTTSLAGTYVDGGELVTTTDGLQANNLSLTVDTVTNTLAEPGDPPSESIGMTNDVLFHVDDANVLYVDDGLVGINQAPGTLVLTLPFFPAL